jgi:hypothetical protein
MLLRFPRWILVGVVLTAIAPAAAEAVPVVVDQTDPSPIQYRIEGGPLRSLAPRFKPAEIELLEKLNRADLKHLTRLTRVVVPSEFRSEMEHSPFPHEYQAAKDTPKLIVVDQPTQVFAAYEFGRQVRWGPVSSGRKEKPTPSGLVHLNWRSRSRTSTLSGEWRLNWYFNFNNRRGLAFHEFELPGVPASHACFRLLTRDAMWIFNWGESWTLDAKGHLAANGTPVLILGDYNYAAPPPWQSAGFAWAIALPESVPIK